MAGINRVMLVGVLSKTPETKTVGNGNTVVNFSVKTSEDWLADDGTTKSRTQFTRCVAWGKVGTLVSALSEGDWVAVDGRLSTRSWDGDGGKKNYITEVNCSSAMPMFDATTGAAADDMPF